MKSLRHPFLALLAGLGFGWPGPLPGQDAKPFTIRVVDAATGRGVPLVELKTTHDTLFLTDNAGLVTVTEPELIGEEIYFHIRSHGYEKEKDGFGYQGARFSIEPGGEGVIEIKRLNIAERLYRVTGAGLYDHSIRAGRETPLARPLLNGRVFGCDSVLNAIWNGKLFWIWGDTNRPSYPLGNFQTTAAVSDLPADGGLDPAHGVDLRYYIGEKGFVKGVAPMAGEGPTWLTGLAVLPDREGKDHLVAHFVKVKGFLDVYRRGLCEWDEAESVFREIHEFPDADAPQPVGHPFIQEIDGRRMMTFADPLPTLRIPATYEAWRDPSQYQAIQTRESFKDAATADRVKPHRGSIEWNAHRQRWVMIFTETGGKPSQLGEVWYAEAKSTEGPWDRCVRIVTHDRYSFYNPRQHPYFAQEGDRVIYFEGTYTATFSGNPNPTPKYDYNQVMYRLDLDDERLAPARVE